MIAAIVRVRAKVRHNRRNILREGIRYVAERRTHAIRFNRLNLIFGLAEIAGLLLIFYGPANNWVLGLGMVLFGLGMTGLVTALGGLFATDICPKKAAGAVMGMIGVFSYLGAAIQEQVQQSRSMTDLVKYLKDSNIQFTTNAGVKSAEQLPMEILPKLHELKDGQTAVLPSPAGLTLVHIAGSQQRPLDEASARPFIELAT